MVTADDLKKRTKEFALRAIRLSESLPHSGTGFTIGRQLVRCGTSVGANYRAACRARSAADFAAKMAIVEEEADECVYWMELLVEAGLVPIDRLTPLMQEASELTAIAAASRKTSRANNSRKRTRSGRVSRGDTQSPVESSPAAIDNRQSTIGNQEAAS